MVWDFVGVAALQIGGSGIPFNHYFSCSILSFLAVASQPHHHAEWQMSSITSLPFRVSSAQSFQVLFPSVF